jgi:hypothetical protein
MRLIQRTATAWRALFDAIAGIGSRHTEAMLEVERENLRRLIDQSNRSLASHAGLTDRLMSRTRILEQEELTQRLRVAVRVMIGSRADAGRAAVELQSVQRQLAAIREQLGLAEHLHRSLTKSRELAIAAAKARIASVRRTIGDPNARRATEELDEIAGGQTAATDGIPTLDRLRNTDAGRAQVEQAVGLDRQPGHKAEQAALAAALEEFLAQDGGLVVRVPSIAIPGGGSE